MAMVSAGAAQPRTAGEVLSAAVTAIRDRLPRSWSLSTVRNKWFGDGRPDAVLTIRASGGEEVVLLVAVKRRFEVRDVAAMRTQLDNLIAQRPGSVGIVAASYLSPSLRHRLAAAGLSYVDVTGNVFVRADTPSLFLSDRGADSDPWRGPGRPKGTLKGEPAAKVVRALADLAGPWRVRDLVSASGATTGSVYRVIQFLETESLAVRGRGGLVSIPSWRALLRRWSADYQFLHTNTVTRGIAPRGLPNLLERVRSSDFVDYALTGSVAAAAWEAYAPVRSAMVYANDPTFAANAWDVWPTEAGANVLIAKPSYHVVFERAVDTADGLRVAAPTQVAVDLMTGPGRAPSEAEALLDWMEANEWSWR